MFFLSKFTFPLMYLTSVSGTMLHLVDWVWNTGFIWAMHYISCCLTDSDTAPTVFPSHCPISYFLLAILSISPIQKHGVLSHILLERSLSFDCTSLLYVSIHYFAPYCNKSSWKSHLSFLTQILLLPTPLNLITIYLFLMLAFFFNYYFQIYYWFLYVMRIVFISLIKYNSYAVRGIFSFLFTNGHCECIKLTSI